MTRYEKYLGVVLAVTVLVGVLVAAVMVGPDLLEIRTTQAACEKYFTLMENVEIYTIGEFREELKELLATSERANPVLQEALMQLLAEITQFSEGRSTDRPAGIQKMEGGCNNLQSVKDYFFES